MLQIRGLTKRYRTGDLALKGIDLDVRDGEVMALIGPSGAGKSTVIRCINRLVEPTGGIVTLNDVNITTLGSRELRRARRHMGMIFQEYALVERLSVMECAERSAWLCRILAEFHAEISAERRRPGVPVARTRRPRSCGR
jgi:phosphonate transport system ATP-binding protein